ncbi:hypothetical protein Chor_014342 [Crotalus horridus]
MKLSVLSHLLAYYLFQVSAVTREYYIGINEVDWNYAPGTKNILSGKPFSEDEFRSRKQKFYDYRLRCWDWEKEALSAHCIKT